ncbi:FecR family protein [Jeongeupia chitinilytica]|uniref:Sensor n=1 Tax=Jeongeupia chitinilytica TaxID=1041641 RepID=A0ABQ3H797_9NEIS|nr:FecR domain-containing protein [Jeongeupia chitinilytica]GHD69980.1 sensor [Jeongeupia chitinilytica]
MSRVRNDAARWFVRMRDAAPDDPARGRFEAWRLADPAHGREYAAFAELWDDFDSNARLAALAGAAELHGNGRRRMLKHGTLGLFACLSGGLGWLGWRRTRPAMSMQMATAIGEVRSVPLDDGSTLTLSASTRLSLDYDAGHRNVVLHAGEAIFDVAADPGRPFGIDGGTVRITVLGTRFAVARLPDRVRVSVASGRVRVARQDADGHEQPPHWLLGAGDVVDFEGGLARRSHRRVDDGFAWQRGALMFDDASLPEVAATLSRYRPRPVVASGDGPRLTAVVQANDIDAFLRALPRAGSVRVVETPAATRLYAR